MKQHPYEARRNAESKPYVKGPGTGLDYYAGSSVFPHLVCKTDEEAERCAQIANIAYQNGYAAAQAAMQQALGIPPRRFDSH